MMAGTIFAESYGYKKWEFSTSGKLSKPAINKDGTIYVSIENPITNMVVIGWFC